MNRRSPDAFPFPTFESHPSPAPESAASTVRTPVDPAHAEPALDHGIEESFPASDPVSIAVTQVHAVPSCGDRGLASAQRRRQRTARSSIGIGLMAGAFAAGASAVMLAWRSPPEGAEEKPASSLRTHSSGAPDGESGSLRPSATTYAAVAVALTAVCAVARRNRRKDETA